MSKKVKFLIILISIILIIGLSFGIITIVKFCKLQKIIKSVENYVGYDNFYLKIENTINNEEPVIIEAFYRNGTGKLLTSTGIYNWANNDKAYIVDEENKTAYVLKVENNKEVVSYEMFLSIIPGYNKNLFEKLFLVGNIFNKIKVVNLEDGKAYLIEIMEQKGKVKKSVWVDKHTFKPVKALMEFESGEKIKYKYDLKFNSVDLLQVELPNFKEYKLIDYETGEELQNNQIEI